MEEESRKTESFESEEKFDGLKVSVTKSTLLLLLAVMGVNFFGLKEASEINEGSLAKIERQISDLKKAVSSEKEEREYILNQLDTFTEQHDEIIRRLNTLEGKGRPHDSGQQR